MTHFNDDCIAKLSASSVSVCWSITSFRKGSSSEPNGLPPESAPAFINAQSTKAMDSVCGHTDRGVGGGGGGGGGTKERVDNKTSMHDCMEHGGPLRMLSRSGKHANFFNQIVVSPTPCYSW